VTADAASALHGVLVVDKPAGPTSHDVVARVRRLTHTRRVGHTGTLDPLATGVLPLVLGRATRLARFLGGGEKRYEADIRLGAATDTFDAEGAVTWGPGPPNAEGWAGLPSADAVAAALAAFVGVIEQVPPAFSAKKVGGVAAHRLARQQRPVPLAAVRVELRRAELLAYREGLAHVRLACSPGFYVRALAHDLGVRLGCGAHLAALRRTASGEFDEAAAVPLDVLEADPSLASARLVGLDGLLAWTPAAWLTERGAALAAHGATVAAADVTGWLDGRPGSPVRLIAPDGRLVAVATGAAGTGAPLHPEVVLVYDK